MVWVKLNRYTYLINQRTVFIRIGGRLRNDALIEIFGRPKFTEQLNGYPIKKWASILT